MNVEEIKVMRIWEHQLPVHIMTDQKQLQNVEYLNNLCRLITNDAISVRKINDFNAVSLWM